MIGEFVFFLFAATSVVSAVFVITRENPVASVLFLVVTLFSLAGLFVLLDAHFIAAVQVIVYAGAIMVLFLFVVMLLNLGHARLAEYRGAFARMLAGSLAVALTAFAGRLLLAGAPAGGAGGTAVQQALDERGAIGAVAIPLFRDYLIPFEVTSILLLVAIVGAVVLARRQAP
jgi:NADH-quinone oxidoreductase subunit J